MNDAKQAKIAIHFGALCDPIATQLSEAGVRFYKEQCEVWQKNANAITRLAAHQILPDSATHAARKRLMKKIVKQLEQRAALAPTKGESK